MSSICMKKGSLLFVRIAFSEPDEGEYEVFQKYEALGSSNMSLTQLL